MSKKLTTLVDRVGNEQILLKTRESARKLWLSGLGAYSLATRSGLQTFEMLVRKGKAFSPKARRQIEEKSAELISAANDTIDRGEKLFVKRLLRPLDFLVLASKRDIEQLAKRLLQLTAEVQKLSGAPTRTAKPQPKPAAEISDSSPMIASAS